MTDDASPTIEVPIDLLRRLVALAAAEADSEWDEGRYLEDEDVEVMRFAAVLTGQDPIEVTPDRLKCRYSGYHEVRPTIHHRGSRPSAVTRWKQQTGISLTPEMESALYETMTQVDEAGDRRWCIRCGETWGSLPPPLSELVARAALRLGIVKGPADD